MHRAAPDANSIPKGSSNAQCQLCERFFKSRNAVFRHLDVCDKNPSNINGANDDAIPMPTNDDRKKRKREEKQPPPYSEADVWFGGFPRRQASMKGLSKVIWDLNLNLKNIIKIRLK